MEHIAFLDLEETIIDNWDTFFPVNVEKVKKWINEQPFGTKFGCFSFAVYDEKDKQKLWRVMNDLEMEFGFVFEPELIFTVDTMRRVIAHHLKLLDVTRDEVISVFKKEQAFTLFSKQACFNGKSLTLLDDTVQDITIINDTTGTHVKFVNVDNLPD